MKPDPSSHVECCSLLGRYLLILEDRDLLHHKRLRSKTLLSLNIDNEMKKGSTDEGHAIGQGEENSHHL